MNPPGGYSSDYTTLLSELSAAAKARGEDSSPFDEAQGEYRRRFGAVEEIEDDEPDGAPPPEGPAAEGLIRRLVDGYDGPG
ncbi:MAG: hypothetical protein K2X87_05310 [Gemmataceae bacterium]|nr:hypothetical protein [Gemmataceae bacterium]